MLDRQGGYWSGQYPEPVEKKGCNDLMSNS